jgi:AcrR family transcriptional regulator
MATVKGARLTRTETALRTRRRMTRAAYELFTEQGYPTTTMAAIAARAGVAVQTLYFTFGTKAALLQNAYDYAVIGEGESLPPEQQPWYGEFVRSETLHIALTVLVGNVGTVLARTAPLDDFVRSAAHEPDPARIRQQAETRRRQAWTRMTEHLADTFGLRAGLGRQHAVDIMMLLMGPTTYQTLVGESGWTPAQWRDWCTTALGAQVFGASRESKT